MLCLQWIFEQLELTGFYFLVYKSFLPSRLKGGRKHFVHTQKGTNLSIVCVCVGLVCKMVALQGCQERWTQGEPPLPRISCDVLEVQDVGGAGDARLLMTEELELIQKKWSLLDS